MPGEAEQDRITQVELAWDEVRARFRGEQFPSDYIEANSAGFVAGGADAVLASFTVGAGVTTGTFADIYDMQVTVAGAVGPYAMAYLKDRRRGTLWSMAGFGTSQGQLLNYEQHTPWFTLPIFASLQGTVVLAINATAGSATGRLRAFVDHDGTETYAAGRA